MAIKNISELKPFLEKNGISVHLLELNKEQIAEDDFLKQSKIESASAEIFSSLFLKIQSIMIFDDIVRRFNFSFKHNLLELGGGFGFLSAYIKKRFPELHVAYSDVSPEGAMKCLQYEDFFKVTLDEKWITAAEDTPFKDTSFSNILFFAAFHHVQHPQEAINECRRILKPQGKLYMFMEPSCPFYLKPLYNYHVQRETVKENFYTRNEYVKMFNRANFDIQMHYYKNFTLRWSAKSTLYYMLLTVVPKFLTGILPCSQVIVGTKR